MDSLIEPIRYTTSLFVVATVIAMLGALKGDPRDRPPIMRAVLPWLAVFGGLGWFLSHVDRTLFVAPMVPAGALAGLGLGVAALFSPRVAARYAALEDGQWRALMLLRALFGALVLA